MLERKAIIDPGGWSLKLYDTRSKKAFSIRSCLYKDASHTITGIDALQAYWDKGKSRILYPISQGKVLLDVKRLFRDLTDQTHLFSRLLKPIALVVLPQDVLEEQRAVWVSLGMQAGFRKVEFVSTMDLLAKECGIVIHAGHTNTEIAVYYGGKQLEWKKLIYAGQQIDEKIIDTIASQYKSLIFSEDAAALRESASRAFWQQRNPRMSLTALSYTSLYRQIEMPCTDVWPAMEEILSQIVMWCRELAAKHGPDVAEAVFSVPITLSGGLAECFGLVQMLSLQLGVPAVVEEQPRNALLYKGAQYSKKTR